MQTYPMTVRPAWQTPYCDSNSMANFCSFPMSVFSCTDDTGWQLTTQLEKHIYNAKQQRCHEYELAISKKSQFSILSTDQADWSFLVYVTKLQCATWQLHSTTFSHDKVARGVTSVLTDSYGKETRREHRRRFTRLDYCRSCLQLMTSQNTGITVFLRRYIIVGHFLIPRIPSMSTSLTWLGMP